ncbi:hypothetical protein Q8A67_015507 [Cirrhinus molitorella]|uniref:Uncharacterized protein n=2 Tax=Cirrhinus molitorella TaxID=172907 RepID=A0AA88PMI7_9TELE|nr:hypothetical protein Q8A67_015507 [Cirrhinus molitorella]
MERLGRLFINLQQVRQVPQMLTEALPCTANTLRDTEVPCFFRERYIHSGYRPLHQTWRYYFWSLLQRHNETINVWTHLIGALVVLSKIARFAETVDFMNDPHSWPLLILLLSSASYLTFSTVAHLLAAKSELCHYGFFYLDYVGVALYQYGSAVVHYYYAIEESWHACVRGCFMPIASFLCCLSCFGCCYGKYRNYSLPSWVRKIGQVVPSALAYSWDTSPVFHRFVIWFLSWTRGDFRSSPALLFHFGQSKRTGTDRLQKHKGTLRSTAMGIKLYYTTVTASREVKSQQAEVIRILDSKSIKYELIDISVGGAVRDEMRSKSGNPTAIPPQIFNEDQYCGNYEMFSEAVEADTVEQFLKIA